LQKSEIITTLRSLIFFPSSLSHELPCIILIFKNRYHPDSNKDDQAAIKKFQEASEAYEVLSDTEKRQSYDNFGHAGVDGNTGGSSGGPFGGGFGTHENLNDLFEQLFSSGQRRGPQRGQNIQYRLELTFLEAVHGCTKEFSFQYQVIRCITKKLFIYPKLISSTDCRIRPATQSAFTQPKGRSARGCRVWYDTASTR